MRLDKEAHIIWIVVQHLIYIIGAKIKWVRGSLFRLIEFIKIEMLDFEIYFSL